MNTETINKSSILSLKNKNDEKVLVKTSVYSKLYHLINEGNEHAIELFDYFIEKENLDINYVGTFWTSLLCFSIFMKEEKIAIYLIEKGANVRYMDPSGLTALNYCVAKIGQEKNGFKPREDIEMAKVLIVLMSKGANLVHKNPLNGFFPAREAHLCGYEILYKLINNKISNINKNPEKYPIQSKEIMNFMFDESNFDICPEKPQNILDACFLKNEELALKMVKEDPQLCIHFLDDLNQNALHYAIQHQMYSLCKKLILEGINFEQKSIANFSPIDLIFFYKNENDKLNMMEFLDIVFAKLDKNNIEKAKEDSMNDFKYEQENIQIQKEEQKQKKIKELEFIKKKKLIEKKHRVQLKKQKKFDTNIQYKEIQLMDSEDTMYIEKKFRIKQKEHENEQLYIKFLKKSKKKEKLLMKDFFFNCEKFEIFWEESDMVDQ
jgi:hypothetical protein